MVRRVSPWLGLAADSPTSSFLLLHVQVRFRISTTITIMHSLRSIWHCLVYLCCLSGLVWTRRLLATNLVLYPHLRLDWIHGAPPTTPNVLRCSISPSTPDHLYLPILESMDTSRDLVQTGPLPLTTPSFSPTSVDNALNVSFGASSRWKGMSKPNSLKSQLRSSAPIMLSTP